MEIKIHSPVGAGNVSFIWPLDKLKQEAKRAPRRREEKHSIGEDIIETIRLISEDLPNLKNALDNNILTDYDPDDYYSVKHVCDRYNKMINSLVALEKGTSLPQKRINKYPSKSMLKHILQQTYFRSVIDPDKLNNYEPFSPEVYGETSYDLICDIINHVQFSDDDVFIDLGSGIGQVVLQVAASTSCKLCYGIEKAEIPSSYAIQMSEIFQQWMKFYGKSIGEYEILKGDFLSDEFRNMINTATIIFVNNFAFGPGVDHKLKQIFSELKDGTRIFSSKRFCAANFRISNRNLSDIGAIMDISDVELVGQVSWTDKPVQYFLQVIDRSKLELYFERLKLNNLKDYESDSSKSDEHNKNDGYKVRGSGTESDSDDPDFEISRKKRNRCDVKIGSSRSSSRSSKAEVIETYPNRVVIKNDNKNDKWMIKTQGALPESNPKKYADSSKNNVEIKNRSSESHLKGVRKSDDSESHLKSNRNPDRHHSKSNPLSNGILSDPKYSESKTTESNFVSNRLESILLGNRLDYYPKKYRIDLKSHSEINLKISESDPKGNFGHNPIDSGSDAKSNSESDLKERSDGNLKSYSESNLKFHYSKCNLKVTLENNVKSNYFQYSESNERNRHSDDRSDNQRNDRVESNQKSNQRKNHKRSEKNRSDKNNQESHNRFGLEVSQESNRSECCNQDETKRIESCSEGIPRSNRLESIKPDSPFESRSIRSGLDGATNPESVPKIPSIVIKTTKQGKSRIIQKKLITKAKPRKPKKKKKVINIPELDLLHEQITKCPEASASFENENFEAYTSSELIKASSRLLDDYKIVDNDKWENYASDRLKTVQNGNIIYDERYDDDERLKVDDRWDYDNFNNLRVHENRTCGAESGWDGSVQTGVKRRYDDGYSRGQSTALDNLLSSYQSQFLEMVRIMQTAEFRQQIEVQIEHERNRNRVLKKSVGLYEDTVKYLMKKGESLIKERMLELSITNFTTRDLFRTAREWFNEQGHLRNIVTELEAQNAELENEIEKRRHELYKSHYVDYQSQEVFLNVNNNKLPVKAVNVEADVDDLEANRQIIAG